MHAILVRAFGRFDKISNLVENAFEITPFLASQRCSIGPKLNQDCTIATTIVERGDLTGICINVLGMQAAALRVRAQVRRQTLHYSWNILGPHRVVEVKCCVFSNAHMGDVHNSSVVEMRDKLVPGISHCFYVAHPIWLRYTNVR